MAKQVRFVAFQRGKEFSKINVKKYNVLLLNNPIYKYSSTDYKNGNLDMVEPQVQEYIGENFLYFEEIAKAWLFDKNTPKGELDRFLHLK
ncbi:putative nicotinate-nucleotide adenylyltransferase [Mycoplasmopsis arginini]|nr:putative nicotinate-nucleotide adenylyltransferase [Chlamydia trachomatis]SGA02631.1 putative nicotinate-nucleotide adenylyltransferase [Chlamydia abortus]SGA15032.1 putative nicotinate-nucleotide adenylyltransferase [Mycoplasmopsis arginini]CRH47338.1 putative nicotinate-nucleotide adenylyltransferase [Chlamydia trachomatis]CRH55402.1 putative nicotinate-nucleotide adenylyltransferase [Chlamydia trachomatis]